VQATDQGQKNGEKVFDEALEEIAPCLAPLPYDTFRTVKSKSGTVQPQKEAVVAVTDSYTLHVVVLAEDSQGRLRVHVWVEESVTKGEKTETRKAVDTTSAVAPGKHLVLRGLALPKGELIIVLKFTS
jgi:hypothetical protein